MNQTVIIVIVCVIVLCCSVASGLGGYYYESTLAPAPASGSTTPATSETPASTPATSATTPPSTTPASTTPTSTTQSTTSETPPPPAPTPASTPATFNPQNQPIKSVNNTSMCLDNPGGNPNSVYPLQSYSCNGTGAQNWTYKNGTLVNTNGLCLDINGLGYPSSVFE